MFGSRIFVAWFIAASAVWVVLFSRWDGGILLRDYWHYSVMMVFGAFVAGLTPEGGGAVAFPVLSVFFKIDREIARDFSLMIQSIGMTSASIYILSHPKSRLQSFVPLAQWFPFACVGFVIGIAFFQAIPVYLIQSVFLCFITVFSVLYLRSKQRGFADTIQVNGWGDKVYIGTNVVAAGISASLFGTGADILFYTMLVSHFGLREKLATQMSIILMAALSVVGFGYRAFVEDSLNPEQYASWICAYPVVLFMAPLGSCVLHRINKEWMLRGVVLLNLGQLLYFNLSEPTLYKWIASAVFIVLCTVAFSYALGRLGDLRDSDEQGGAEV